MCRLGEEGRQKPKQNKPTTQKTHNAPLNEGDKFLQHSQLQPTRTLTEGKTAPDLILSRAT